MSVSALLPSPSHAQDLLIDERSPLLKYYANCKQIHLSRQSEAKITTAMPSGVDVLHRPIVYQPAAKQAVATSRSMLAEEMQEEKVYNVARTEEVQLLAKKLRALEADRKALINLIIIESAASSDRALKITADTKRWLRHLETERDRPIGDPADITNTLTRYAAVTIHIAQHLHEFPAFERERLMHASFRVHRRALQLQKELVSRAHHDVDFLNVVAHLADAKAPRVEPKQVSDYIEGGYKGQVPKPPGTRPPPDRSGGIKAIRSKPPERGWEKVNNPDNYGASSANSPRKDSDDENESTESSPTKSESVSLVVAPPSGSAIPRKPHRQHLLMTEMQKRQLSPVPLNTLPPIPPFPLARLRSRQKKATVHTV